MTPNITAPCQCRTTRVPISVASTTTDDGRTHRLSACDPVAGATIILTPEVPKPWRLLNAVCSHSEALWVTGAEPELLLEALGCGCPERGAA